jgi:hypothetical protein
VRPCPDLTTVAIPPGEIGGRSKQLQILARERSLGLRRRQLLIRLRPGPTCIGLTASLEARTLNLALSHGLSLPSPGRRITLPADVAQIDQTGYVWTFLDRAAETERVVPGVLSHRVHHS